MIISPSSHKPLYLFHLLHTLSISSALCFTKSVEAATRLAKLVEFFEEARIAAEGEGAKRVVVKAYSSELAPGERNKVLRDFKKGDVQMCVSLSLPCLSLLLVFLSCPSADSCPSSPSPARRLICSDLIARGIDIPNVSHVISYDIPADMRKYVHRVGRTARAGNKGDAWSLVEEQEVRSSLSSSFSSPSPSLPLSLSLSFSLSLSLSLSHNLLTRLPPWTGRALQVDHVVGAALRQDRPRARQGLGHRGLRLAVPGRARAPAVALCDGQGARAVDGGCMRRLRAC